VALGGIAPAGCRCRCFGSPYGVSNRVCEACLLVDLTNSKHFRVLRNGSTGNVCALRCSDLRSRDRNSCSLAGMNEFFVRDCVGNVPNRCA
jgi:hypothetical protein